MTSPMSHSRVHGCDIDVGVKEVGRPVVMEGVGCSFRPTFFAAALTWRDLVRG